MIDRLEQLKEEALKELDSIEDTRELELWRVKYLGKKSELTRILRSLASLEVEERKTTGAAANRLRGEMENRLAGKKENLRTRALSEAAGKEEIDVTLPGRPVPTGHVHPITSTIEEVCDIFYSMGFQLTEGPDVEWNYYNFQALNIPDEHPARDVMSTSWIDTETDADMGPMLLRTHTTSVTAMVIESREPPIRVIEPGKVYRYEATDATHTPMFHQVDGLAIDRGITMADLKGSLYEFARRFFGEGRKARFRCDYFPFVEPGVEMAIDCRVCKGRGCRLCSNTGWIEILGAGMAHPNVLERGGIDPEVYSGFAFGMGIDRLAMLRYGIDDIRLFYSNDLRFLSQFQ